jgi:hypothetical protein
MAVPSGNSHKRNTTGGAFVHAKQGGTILNNNSTTITNSVLGDGIITKAFELDDANNYDRDQNLLPSENASGIYEVHKPLTAGTFAFVNAAGKYVMARVSETLSGAANTKLLFMGTGSSHRSIAQFVRDSGAMLLKMWRENRFTWMHRLDSGAVMVSRGNWINAGGTAAAAPDTILSATGAGVMWAPGGATRDGTGAFALNTDAAANGYAGTSDGSGLSNNLRGVPGRLVMKANFINLNTWTDVKSSARPDFYLYKPITGM